MNLRAMACCGMREIAGLEFTGGAKDAMEEFIKAAMPKSRRYSYEKHKYECLARLNFSHVVFSEAKDGSGSYGEKFAELIQKDGLGDIVASQRRVNPNSGNQLKFWVWTLNKQGLVAWAKKHKVHKDATLFNFRSDW